jgi:hypothetical protein
VSLSSTALRQLLLKTFELGVPVADAIEHALAELPTEPNDRVQIVCRRVSAPDVFYVEHRGPPGALGKDLDLVRVWCLVDADGKGSRVRVCFDESDHQKANLQRIQARTHDQTFLPATALLLGGVVGAALAPVLGMFTATVGFPLLLLGGLAIGGVQGPSPDVQLSELVVALEQAFAPVLRSSSGYRQAGSPAPLPAPREAPLPAERVMTLLPAKRTPPACERLIVAMRPPDAVARAAEFLAARGGPEGLRFRAHADPCCFSVELHEARGVTRFFVLARPDGAGAQLEVFRIAPELWLRAVVATAAVLGLLAALVGTFALHFLGPIGGVTYGLLRWRRGLQAPEQERRHATVVEALQQGFGDSGRRVVPAGTFGVALKRCDERIVGARHQLRGDALYGSDTPGA